MLEKIQISIKFQCFQLRPPPTKKMALNDVFLGYTSAKSPHIFVHLFLKSSHQKCTNPILVSHQGLRERAVRPSQTSCEKEEPGFEPKSNVKAKECIYFTTPIFCFVLSNLISAQCKQRLTDRVRDRQRQNERICNHSCKVHFL